MSKTVVIHQPDFIPHAGFFQRFLSADIYLVLDHVQFVTGTSRSWTHRDKIRTSKGEQWLSISLCKASMNTPINEIEISYKVDWRLNNLRLIKENYRKALFYEEIIPYIDKLYLKSNKMLLDFNLRSIRMLMLLLNVERPIILSSSLSPKGVKNELLLDLLCKVNATHYLSGVGAKDYLDELLFDKSNINLIGLKGLNPFNTDESIINSRSIK